MWAWIRMPVFFCFPTLPQSSLSNCLKIGYLCPSRWFIIFTVKLAILGNPPFSDIAKYHMGYVSHYIPMIFPLHSMKKSPFLVVNRKWWWAIPHQAFLLVNPSLWVTQSIFQGWPTIAACGRASGSHHALLQVVVGVGYVDLMAMSMRSQWPFSSGLLSVCSVWSLEWTRHGYNKWVK